MGCAPDRLRATVLLLTAWLGACRAVDTIGVLNLHDSDFEQGTADGSPASAGAGGDAGSGDRGLRVQGPADTPAAPPPPDPPGEPPAPPGAPPPPEAFSCQVDVASGCSRERAAAFAYSLCTCNSVIGAAGLSVDATSAGGAVYVGVNGMFAATALGPGGAWMGDMGGGAGRGPQRDPMPAPLGRLDIAGDLRVGGALLLAGELAVKGDLWSAAAPLGTGTLRVGGDLHSPAPVPMAPNLDVSGTVRTDPWPGPPCACDPAARLDIAGLVREAAQRNDNAQRDIRPDALTGVLDAAQLDLGCGRHYLSSVAVLGTLTLHVSGHAIVFVDGDFTAGSVRSELAEGAQLDLLVAGNFTGDDNVSFAAPDQAARARIYIANQLLFVVALDRALANNPERATVVGNFYAPNANLQLAEPLTLHGSLFVNQLFLLQDLALQSTLPQAGDCGF